MFAAHHESVAEVSVVPHRFRKTDVPVAWRLTTYQLLETVGQN